MFGFGIIPLQTRLEDLESEKKAYHISCYQLFTNKEKFDRAKRAAEIPLPGSQIPVELEPSAPKRSLRIQQRRVHEAHVNPDDPCHLPQTFCQRNA